ncbi:hypothetical protein MMC26_001902 [Xylographa opegraphella]|nr:hypothetical protein [Xylographa opegraphella]
MENKELVSHKASAFKFSATPTNRASLPNTTRTEDLSSSAIANGNAEPPIMDATIRGRQMTGGCPQMQKPVPRREKKIASTLLFAHETIGTKETMGTKQYPQKAKKPLGGPAYVENRNRSVSSGQGDLGDVDDDNIGEGSDYGDGLTALQKAHQVALDSVHNLKVDGGRGPQARKISAALNSDDEIIVRMKTEKRTDREIAQTLQDAGRVNYNYKTIGSRWKRLRTAMAKAKDRELNEQAAVWRVEEDEGLLKAVEAAERVVYRMKQEADEQRWEIITGKLKDLIPTAIYSQNACRDRYEALENGTAVIPVEVDDDPMQRIQQLAETRVLYETKLAEEEKLAEEAKKVSKEAKRIKRLQTEAAKRAAEAQRHAALSESRGGRDSSSSDVTGGNSEVTDQLDESRVLALPNPRSSSPATAQNPDVLPSDIPVPRQITSLSFRAQVAAEAERPDIFGAGIQLKDPDLMNRNELRYELKARGLCRDQVKEELVKIVKAARAGATNLKPSPIRGNLNLISLGRDPSLIRPDLKADVKNANQARYVRAPDSQNDEPANKKAKTSTGGVTDRSNPHEFNVMADTNSKPSDPGQWCFDPVDREKSCLSFARSFPTLIYRVIASSDFNQGHHFKYHELVTSGRRLFLWNFPADTTIDTICSLLEPDMIENLCMLGGYHTLVVDMVDRATAKAAIKAIDGSIFGRQIVAAESALSVARAHQETLSKGNDLNYTGATYGFNSTDSVYAPRVPQVEYVGEPDMNNFVYVSDVPNVVSNHDLERILGNTVSCDSIKPGVFLVEFKDAASTEMALVSSDGFRIYGQPVKIQRAEPESPKAMRPARRLGLEFVSDLDNMDTN